MIALSTKINYKTGIAEGYLNIGSAYNFKKDHYNEDEYFNKALTLYKETKDTQKIIRCYNWISFLYTQDNEVTKAFKAIYAAQKLSEQTGNKKTIADGFLHIALTFVNSPGNNSQEELKNGLVALKLYKQLNDRQGIGNISYYIGHAYLIQHKYAEALGKYLKLCKCLKTAGRYMILVIFMGT